MVFQGPGDDRVENDQSDVEEDSQWLRERLPSFVEHLLSQSPIKSSPVATWNHC